MAWEKHHCDQALAGWGARDLLNEPLTAFFASRQCPGAAIRAVMDYNIVVAHASPAGSLAALVALWRQEGLRLDVLAGQ